MPDEPRVATLPISVIVRDDINQRSRIDHEWVAELADVCFGHGVPTLRPFKDLPVCYYDSETYWLADGEHRLQAALNAGLTQLEFLVHRGSKRDALRYALAANADHGKPRTADDKRKAVVTALNDPVWGQLSDRQIAEMCRVDASWVGRIRRDIRGEPPDPKKQRFKASPSPPARQPATSGADGPHSAHTGQPADTPRPVEPVATYRLGVRDAAGRLVPDHLSHLFLVSSSPAEPAYVCLVCQGTAGGKARCQACSGRGWFAAQDFASAPPAIRELHLQDKPVTKPDPVSRALGERPRFEAAVALAKRLARLLDELAQGPGGYYLRDAVRVTSDRGVEPALQYRSGRVVNDRRYPERYVHPGLMHLMALLEGATPRAPCAGRFADEGHAGHDACRGQGWLPAATIQHAGRNGVQLDLFDIDPWDDGGRP